MIKKSTLAIATVLVVLTVFMTARIFRSRMEYSPPAYFPFALKTYKVLPSDTDDHPYDRRGGRHDCPTIPLGPVSNEYLKSACGRATVRAAIGCERCWPVLDADGREQQDGHGFLISAAPDRKHVLYVPVGTENTGKLLVFLAGDPGNPDQDGDHEAYHWLYRVMAYQGYHVLGLSTYTGVPCGNDLECYEDYMREGITGEDFTTKSDLNRHPQDSLLNRLVKVLEWAATKHGEDGWGRYLTGPINAHDVDWTQVHLAAFSAGTSYASYMGKRYQVGRVALIAGPNDGWGASEEEWKTADYIQRIDGLTDTRYYGLVHQRNKAKKKGDEWNLIVYKVTEAWRKFGMEDPLGRVEFDPKPGETPDFRGSHMLISTDTGTTYKEAHISVVLDEYENCDGLPEPNECTEGNRIGYEAAWRYILGTGY